MQMVHRQSRNGRSSSTMSDEQETEVERQYRVVDQLISMHSRLRDNCDRSARNLNHGLLVAAIFLNACVFIDDRLLVQIGIDPSLGKIGIGLGSVALLALTIVEVRLDLAGSARKHQEAVVKLSRLKLLYRSKEPAGNNQQNLDE